MAKTTLKIIIGILILPLVVSFSKAFYGQFGNINVFFTKGQQFFLAGIAVYCLVQLLIFKPVYLYVLGHEMVHVLATWLSFGKVTSFKVSSKGGSTQTSKSNLFISLSPYFIPIYSLLLIVIYYFINNVFTNGLVPPAYFMFLLGATLAFHIAMTVDMLKTKQPDLVKAGSISAFIFIYIINLSVVAGMLAILFEGFSFRAFLNNAYLFTVDIYKAIFNQLFL